MWQRKNFRATFFLNKYKKNHYTKSKIHQHFTTLPTTDHQLTLNATTYIINTRLYPTNRIILKQAQKKQFILKHTNSATY